MRIPVSWLAEYAALPDDLSTAELDAALVDAGLEVEEVHDLREQVTGPLVLGRVASIEELTDFKKPIRHCHVDVGEDAPRSIICGARNFSEGDLVVVALPGAVLPGGFAIGSRKTYGRLSEGMICSARELGVSEDHEGIMVLPEDTLASIAVGADARPVVGLDEVVFELAITPDMGYCLSVRGIAREVAHQLGVDFTDPAAEALEPKTTAESPYPLRVEADGCTRFTLRAVRGVDATAESPQWMAKRLTQAGMRPIGLAVDVTNYLMLELGHPLHAFDLDRLSGDLVVRCANAGEKLTTLDDVERVLDVEDMVICDGTGPLSLAGVMGGESSEVGPQTRNVLVEAAHWDSVAIARTARRHKLSSEASKRYERGADAALSLLAAQRTAELLVEYGGGTLVEEVADVDHRRPVAAVDLPIDLPARMVGVDYDRETVVAMLEAAGCTVAEGAAESGETLTVTPATWRPDLTDPVDLVEEVARLHGYAHIPSSIPRAVAGTGLSSRQRRRRRVARALADKGFIETYTFPFVSRERADELGLDERDPQREAVAVLNPLDDTAPLLRTTVLASLVGAVKTNLARGTRDLAVFEEGLVFQPAEDWTELDPVTLPVTKRPGDEAIATAIRRLPVQPRHLAALLCGMAVPAGIEGPGRQVDWADAVEAAEIAAEAAGVSLEIDQGKAAPWHPGRCAELRVDGEVVGHAGELHPEVCEALGLPKRTAAMELDLTAIPVPDPAPAPVISHYPVTLIDVAVVVDEAVPAGEVQAALREGAGELLDGLHLFDVYRDAKLGEDRKSLAFKMELRAADRTLTSEEGVAARDAAVAVAADRFGATIRE